MAWDSSRPVPWQRLAREWLVYVAIMAAIFLVFMRDRPLIGIFAGLIVSGPLYLAIGYVLAKLGYQRARLKRPDDADATEDDTVAVEAGPRPKPAPTKRTGGGGGGGSRPGGSRKRRR